MYKEELVRKVSKETGLTLQMSSKAVNAMLDTIRIAMKSGRSVTLSGFGVFEPQYRSPRTGRNPHTGEAVSIPARIIPSFKPAKSLKDEFERAEVSDPPDKTSCK